MINSITLVLILKSKTFSIFSKSDTILNKLLGTAKKGSIYVLLFTKGTIYFDYSSSALYIFNIRFLSSSAIFPEMTKIQMMDTFLLNIYLTFYKFSFWTLFPGFILSLYVFLLFD